MVITPHTNTNILSLIEQFRQAMQEAGLAYSGQIIPDGKLHRFHVDGHKPGTKNGCYILHADNVPAGYYQDWKTGLRSCWHAPIGRNLTPNEAAERGARMQAAKEQAAKERERDQRKTAEKAQWIWFRQSSPVDKQSHPYLARKRIDHCGARLFKNSLVIPVREPMKGEIVNLQFINRDGKKRFLTGGRKRDCFYPIDYSKHKDPVLVCEGFATGVSLHKSTGRCVIVAFDADNLINVAKLVRKSRPNIRLVICGDNDFSGVGQRKAKAAALAVNGEVLIPPTPGNDWNDEVNCD